MIRNVIKGQDGFRYLDIILMPGLHICRRSGGGGTRTIRDSSFDMVKLEMQPHSLSNIDANALD